MNQAYSMNESDAQQAREQQSLQNNVTALTKELSGLATSISSQRMEFCRNFQTLEQRLVQVESPPRVLQLTGGRNSDVLQSYDGDSDFDDWLSLFQRVKEACNWSDVRALKILPAYLRGNAANLYSELSDAQKVTLNDLVSNLRAALEPEEMARITQSKLVKRRMQPYESVVDFAAAIQRLVKSAYRTLPAEAQAMLMRDEFMERVTPDIKKYLLLFDPKDFQQAKRRAMQIQSINIEMARDEDGWCNQRTDKKPRIMMAQEDQDETTALMLELLQELKAINEAYRTQQSTFDTVVDTPQPRRNSYQPWRNHTPYYSQSNQGPPREEYPRYRPPHMRNAYNNYGSNEWNQETPVKRFEHNHCGMRNWDTSETHLQRRTRRDAGMQPWMNTQYGHYNDDAIPGEVAPTSINGIQTVPVLFKFRSEPAYASQAGLTGPYQSFPFEVQTGEQINTITVPAGETQMRKPCHKLQQMAGTSRNRYRNSRNFPSDMNSGMFGARNTRSANWVRNANTSQVRIHKIQPRNQEVMFPRMEDKRTDIEQATTSQVEVRQQRVFMMKDDTQTEHQNLFQGESVDFSSRKPEFLLADMGSPPEDGTCENPSHTEVSQRSESSNVPRKQKNGEPVTCQPTEIQLNQMDPMDANASNIPNDELDECMMHENENDRVSMRHSSYKYWVPKRMNVMKYFKEKDKWKVLRLPTGSKTQNLWS
ncbi:MAG: hypothetical protein GY820_03810, partial [Gammaproteobacteria bacterium]|nr:hypothetical protein [Gammaproteobacteria bacterium]